jgi:hypothetical protein
MTKTSVRTTLIFLKPLNKLTANIMKCCTANIPKRFIKTKNFFAEAALFTASLI